METSCTQLHMFYVSNKSRELETSAYYNFMHLLVILFFNLLKIMQYLAQTYNSMTIYCNTLQCAIIIIIDILYWPYCIVLQ